MQSLCCIGKITIIVTVSQDSICKNGRLVGNTAGYCIIIYYAEMPDAIVDTCPTEILQLNTVNLGDFTHCWVYLFICLTFNACYVDYTDFVLKNVKGSHNGFVLSEFAIWIHGKSGSPESPVCHHISFVYCILYSSFSSAMLFCCFFLLM